VPDAREFIGFKPALIAEMVRQEQMEPHQNTYPKQFFFHQLFSF
jgi:hypothetical protein